VAVPNPDDRTDRRQVILFGGMPAVPAHAQDRHQGTGHERHNHEHARDPERPDHDVGDRGLARRRGRNQGHDEGTRLLGLHVRLRSV